MNYWFKRFGLSELNVNSDYKLPKNATIWGCGEYSIFLEDKSDRDLLECVTLDLFKKEIFEKLGITVKDHKEHKISNDYFNKTRRYDYYHSFKAQKLNEHGIDFDEDVNIMYEVFKEMNSVHISPEMLIERGSLSDILEEKIAWFEDSYSSSVSEEEEEIINSIYRSFEVLEEMSFDFGDAMYKIDLHAGQFLRNDEDELLCIDFLQNVSY